MKLNKVRGGRENPHKGASTLAGPAQLELSTLCIPVFLPLLGGGRSRPGPSLAVRVQEPTGGRSQRSRGAAGPPLLRCAGQGYISGGSAAGPSLWH